MYIYIYIIGRPSTLPASGGGGVIAGVSPPPLSRHVRKTIIIRMCTYNTISYAHYFYHYFFICYNNIIYHHYYVYGLPIGFTRSRDARACRSETILFFFYDFPSSFSERPRSFCGMPSNRVIRVIKKKKKKLTLQNDMTMSLPNNDRRVHGESEATVVRPAAAAAAAALAASPWPSSAAGPPRSRRDRPVDRGPLVAVRVRCLKCILVMIRTIISGGFSQQL